MNYLPCFYIFDKLSSGVIGTVWSQPRYQTLTNNKVNHFPMSVGVDRFALQQLTTALRVTGVADLTARPQKLEAEFAGLWKAAFEIPASNLTARPKPTDPPSLFRVNIGPSSSKKSEYKHLGIVTVSLGLESFDGVAISKTRSYQWDLSKDSELVEEHWAKLAPWTTLWTDNPDIRRDDGFRVVVTIAPVRVPPPQRPLITDPYILKNTLELMDGQDVIDTKFLVFSHKRVDGNGVVGASDPLPVYASSQVMQAQCEYFENR